METAAAADCARCGTILATTFRFCPECGLPVSGEGVLSTQIDELRRRVEVPRRDSGWRRFVAPFAASGMVAFVVAVGLVLFNRRLLDRVFPPADPGAAEPPVAEPLEWEPEWCQVPAGTFIHGDPAQNQRARVGYPYRISRYEVPNALWLDFLVAEQRRLEEAQLWPESFPHDPDDAWSVDSQGVPRIEPRSLDDPVRNVTPAAVAEFCKWLTARLGQPGVEIRMPTAFEWEYAARGTDGRFYPWGNEGVELPSKGDLRSARLRAGIGYGPLPVHDTAIARDGDESPFGVVAMGGNVAEWTIEVPPDEWDGVWVEPDALNTVTLGGRDAPLSVANLRRWADSRLVSRRGASYIVGAQNLLDRGGAGGDGKIFAPKSWDRSQAGPHDSAKYVGVRLVKVGVAK